MENKMEEGENKLSPGRPKGSKNVLSQQARDLFLNVMEGEMHNVKDALQKVRARDPKEYLDVLAKFLPYFMPKQVDLDVTSAGKQLITWTIEPVAPADDDEDII